MLKKTGLSSFFAFSNASVHHGYQSTGFSACCNRYGLISFFRWLLIFSPFLCFLLFCPFRALNKHGPAYWMSNIPGAVETPGTFNMCALLKKQTGISAQNLHGKPGYVILTANHNTDISVEQNSYHTADKKMQRVVKIKKPLHSSPFSPFAIIIF